MLPKYFVADCPKIMFLLYLVRPSVKEELLCCQENIINPYTVLCDGCRPCLCPGVNFRVAAIKCLPVLHQSADYTFTSFGIIKPILDTLKIEYLLSRC